ncbi:NAD-dependent epimerase/dehydratase family protein [Kribbella monticola]|uniref:NAD-dependent epimerase/dehydratase family protein n=1 Tax=Kribbella monticola TaxID=2185285 RepID=UPI000DD49C66|nr:NAD-dependent epimerase/dehydratase family protein [Kribbella monticola]
MGRVLVTGGAGFIGSHTVDLLVDRGEDVVVLDNLQARVHPSGKPPWLSPSAQLIVGDVANRGDLRTALSGVDRVVHLAAYQDYQTDFHSFIHVNTESMALLFELIVTEQLPISRIVAASSQAVAGEGSYRCEEHGQVTPGPRPVERLAVGDWDCRCPICSGDLTPLTIAESVASPHTAYAVSKRAIEDLASGLGQRYGISTACLRYTYVQGPRNSPHNAYSGIARRFALGIIAGQSPLCFEDGGQIRDFVNVADVAAANVLLLDHESEVGVFNVGGRRPVSVLEFAHIMLNELGSDREPDLNGSFRVGDTRHTVSDLSRLQRLGWEPTIPVEASVHEYVEWLRDQQFDLRALATADAAMRKAGVLRGSDGSAG